MSNRVYRLEGCTNLPSQVFKPVVLWSLPATPPENVYTDLVDRVQRVYRAKEEW